VLSSRPQPFLRNKQFAATFWLLCQTVSMECVTPCLLQALAHVAIDSHGCCAVQVDADVSLRNDVPEGLEVWADSGRIVQVGVHGCLPLLLWTLHTSSSNSAPYYTLCTVFSARSRPCTAAYTSPI
jgi:hypothetical protein